MKHNFLGGISTISSSLNNLAPKGFLFFPTSQFRIRILNRLLWITLIKTYSWGASLALISRYFRLKYIIQVRFLFPWQASGSNLNENKKKEKVKVWEFKWPSGGWATIRINLYPSQEVFYGNSEGLAIFTSSQDFQYKACSVWTHRVITYRLTSKSCLNI